MRNLGRLAMVAALVVSAGAAAPLSAGAVITPTASCTGTTGSVGFTPGLELVDDQNSVQTAAVTAAGLICTGGYVTAGVLSGTLKSSKAVSCLSLLDGIATSSPKWNGHMKAKWTAPAGMEATKATVRAWVKASTGASTTFKIKGTVNADAGLFANRTFTSIITVDKGLNAVANGGSCTVSIPITTSTITASTLKLT